MEKVQKKTTNLKYLTQRGVKKLNYQMDHILYQLFRISLTISSKTLIDNPPIIICINKAENRITFKTKTSYYH